MHKKHLFIPLILFAAVSAFAQSEPTGGTFYVSSGADEYRLQFGWEQYFARSEQGLCVGKFNSDGWIFTINSKSYDSEIKKSDYALIDEYEEAYYSFLNGLSEKLEKVRQSLTSLAPGKSIQDEDELQKWVKANKTKIEAELSKCGIPYDVTYYYIKRIPSKGSNAGRGGNCGAKNITILHITILPLPKTRRF